MEKVHYFYDEKLVRMMILPEIDLSEQAPWIEAKQQKERRRIRRQRNAQDHARRQQEWELQNLPPLGRRAA